MNVPVATYRIQLNSAFDFEDLKKTLPYLSKLGVSHIYASPIFQAKKGSAHGYDVTDSNAISQELGGRAGFEDLRRQVTAFGLHWLQDIVPNHASYSLQNRQIYDLMEKGPRSKHSFFFDVDWNNPTAWLKGKILAPFLEAPFSECVKTGQLRLVFNRGFKINYRGLEFPLNTAASKKLLKNASITQVLENYNRNPERLANLLSNQFYALKHWKTALKRINYRRFFDITDLIGQRMEDPRVFEASHRLIFELAESGTFSALRIDHIDGLFNPQAYLEGLREKLPNTYLLVEKILTGDEQLPDEWPIEGTTGYEFLNRVNNLFVNQRNDAEFTSLYTNFTGYTQPFAELLYECKKTVVENYFLGEATNLTRLIERTLRGIGYGRRFSRVGLRGAVVELLACCPVYRSYLNERQGSDGFFRTALEEARRRVPNLSEELDAIAFLLDKRAGSPTALQALMRLQQFTGSVMAKGFEDTALYRYNRLLSLNEVGSNPVQFGISTAKFHEFNTSRQQKHPLTLNALSTHDTKRGEDARARLNVLSEIPDEFNRNLQKWTKQNTEMRIKVKGRFAPDKNEEYFLYQTLLGSYPWQLSEDEDYTSRVKAQMVKALREAKTHSNWLSPNLPYEKAVAEFTEKILQNQTFLEDFLPLQQKIANFGFFNTLAQTVLKITCPGVPDFYQGSELWDLNLVDPDNRRPVSFQKRRRLLWDIADLEPHKAETLLTDPSDGKAKLYVIHKSLMLRRRMKEFLEQATYLPIAAEGKRRGSVVSFAREKGGAFMVVVVPRFLTGALEANQPWRTLDWADTALRLPADAPTRWRNVFTDDTVHASIGQLGLGDVLRDFPVALLLGGERCA